jgi:hypothetical protein
MRSFASLIAASVLCVGVLAGHARADISAAARAFSDGQAAQLEGNYERAAQSFELAYNIAPSKEALRSAIRARQLNNQLPRAATLAQVLAAKYGDDPTSTKLAAEVIAEARTKLARVSISCTPQCTLAVGGRAISLTAATTHIVFTTPGRQAFEATFSGDRNVTRELTGKAGDDINLVIEPPPPDLPEVKPTAAPAATQAPPADVKPLPPAVALAGVATTLVLGTLTIWSGLDTNKAHDAYVDAPSKAGWNEGRSKQLRTNLLLGGTALAGTGTAAVALLWTRWGTPRANELAVAPTGGGLVVSLRGRF